MSEPIAPKKSNFAEIANGRNILLVDDDADQGYLVETFFRRVSNAKVDAVQSAQAAMDKLAAGGVYDLIILDVMMPEVDGWELFSEIRRMPEYEQVPVMFLTCVMERRHEERARDLGAKCLTLAKPATRQRFQSAIVKLLS